MGNPRIPLLARARMLISLVLLAGGLGAAYGLQLAEANEYMGYRPLNFDLCYLASITAALLVCASLMPPTIRRPSDFFALLYGLFVLLPYGVLHPIRGEVETVVFLAQIVVLAIPLVAVRIIAMACPAVRFPRLASQQSVIWLLVLLCVVGILLALANAPASAGFDLATSYDRRIEGRTVFSPGTPSAYLNATIVNGFAPFLAFVAGWQRKGRLLALAVSCGVAFFYLLGLKAPILFIVVAALIGDAVRRRKIHAIATMMYGLLLGAFTVFLAEYLLFGYSLVGDYLIRRALSVPPYLVSAYFDFMATGASYSWSPLQGVSTGEPITFLVGESFLGYPGLNANTNAFIHKLAEGGVPMYGLTIMLVALVFALLDASYAARRNPALLYLGFSYAILITEQAATTALASSGIGLLVLLTVLSGPNRARRAFDPPLAGTTPAA